MNGPEGVRAKSAPFLDTEDSPRLAQWTSILRPSSRSESFDSDCSLNLPMPAPPPMPLPPGPARSEPPWATGTCKLTGDWDVTMTEAERQRAKSSSISSKESINGEYSYVSRERTSSQSPPRWPSAVRYQLLREEDENEDHLGNARRATVHNVSTFMVLKKNMVRCSCAHFYARWIAGEFVIDPRLGRLWMWDLVVWFMVVWCAWVTPLEVGFARPSVNGIFWFNRVQDIVFFIDMCIQFLVMFPCEKQLRWVRNPTVICETYLTGCFIPDLISLIPYDLLVVFLEERGHVSVNHILNLMMVLRLMRVLRMNRLLVVLKRYEADIELPFALIRAPTFILGTLYFTHALACVWGYLAISETRESHYNWVHALQDDKKAERGPEGVSVDHPGRLYLRALYWAMMTITSIGYGDIVPQNDGEYMVCVLGMAFGGVLWAYTIGTVCGVMSTLDQERTQYEQSMDQVNNFMRHQDLPHELRREMRMFFVQRRHAMRLAKNKPLLDSLSPALRTRVVHYQLQTFVSKVPYLREVASNFHHFQVELHKSIGDVMIPPKELLDFPQCLCALHRGLALKGQKMLVQGSVWGESDVLLSDPTLMDDTVPVALSFVEVMHLPKRSLEALGERFPALGKSLRRAYIRTVFLRAFLHEAKRRRDRGFGGWRPKSSASALTESRDILSLDERMHSLENSQAKISEQMGELKDKLEEFMQSMSNRDSQVRDGARPSRLWPPPRESDSSRRSAYKASAAARSFSEGMGGAASLVTSGLQAAVSSASGALTEAGRGVRGASTSRHPRSNP